MCDLGSDPKTHVSEEAFVSALLASDKLSASPEELAAAYAHASGRPGSRDQSETARDLTLEQLAAFTALAGGSGGLDAADNCWGWVGWIGTVGRPGDGGAPARRALVKARAKCRDAGLLGRSFPGEAFARLDPEGGGRVPRPAFKRALREMGFALVDEAPKGDIGRDEAMPLGWQREPQEHEQKLEGEPGASKILGIVEDDDHTELGVKEIRLHGGEGADEEEDSRRKAFRERVEEIERSTAAKVILLLLYAGIQELSDVVAYRKCSICFAGPMLNQGASSVGEEVRTCGIRKSSSFSLFIFPFFLSRHNVLAAPVSPYTHQINVAATLSDREGNAARRHPSQADTREGAGVEPHVVQYKNDGDESGALPHHPSSVAFRDKNARVFWAANKFGPEDAATLLQSRFRGYRSRKYGATGGGIPPSSAEKNGDLHQRVVEDEHCSILDLEVRSKIGTVTAILADRNRKD